MSHTHREQSPPGAEAPATVRLVQAHIDLRVVARVAGVSLSTVRAWVFGRNGQAPKLPSSLPAGKRVVRVDVLEAFLDGERGFTLEQRRLVSPPFAAAVAQAIEAEQLARQQRQSHAKDGGNG